MRTETDSMGQMPVPEDRYYGAQTARSLCFFNIGNETMPVAIIRALALIKKAAAQVNQELGLLTAFKANLIIKAADEIMQGLFEEDFPLNVWQTGSGTQTNMNVNEVIANRANELAGSSLGSRSPIHPNDDVNLGQSSNDTFPTAMHMAAVDALLGQLLPAVQVMQEQLTKKKEAYGLLIKIGRTHLMDAVPLSFGQQLSGYIFQLAECQQRIHAALPGLYALALGGTAVGTGLNARPGFAEAVISKISFATGYPFTPSENKFAALACHDPLVWASGAIKTLAVALMKIANDFRWMASGPRCGLQELFLPQNEPGSSIMPGKVNPTQCEAMTMISVQVMANDTAISMAGSQGNFELNVFKPLIIYNFLHSVKLLADSCRSFTEHLILGFEVNERQLQKNLENSLMLVTALTPKIGYDKAAKAAKLAFEKDITLKEACLQLKLISAADFDSLIQPANMI